MESLNKKRLGNLKMQSSLTIQKYFDKSLMHSLTWFFHQWHRTTDYLVNRENMLRNVSARLRCLY